MSEETNEVSQATELVVMVEQSGIEKTKGQQLLEMFTPYFQRMHEIELKIKALNSENPQIEDVKIAREIRLSLKNNRVACEKAKDEMKRHILTEGRLIDNFFGIVKNSSKPLEEKCEQIEKHIELKQKAEQERLKNERAEKLAPYVADTTIYPLALMGDDAFNDLLEGLKLAKEKREEEERLAVEAKIAEEKAKRDKEIEMNRRTDELFKAGLKFNGEGYGFKNDFGFVDVPNLDIITWDKETFDKKLAEIKSLIPKWETQQKEKEEAERKEAERLRKENEEKEAQLKAEREAAEAEKKKLEEENQKKLNAEKEAREKAEAEHKAKLEAERKERERLELELKQKKEKEEKEEAERKAKAEAELKQKKEEERKAALAPDKEKLIEYGQRILNVPVPELKTDEGHKIFEAVRQLVLDIPSYIKEKTKEI